MLPVILLTLLTAITRVPAAIETRLFRAVRTPSRFLRFLLRNFNRSLLLNLTLVANFFDEL